MKKPLSAKSKKQLRQLAHKLKPVVIIGEMGLTENVLREIDLSLAHHELIKVRVNAADRAERVKLIQTIESECYANTVQSIGHIAVFYRPSEQFKIKLQ